MNKIQSLYIVKIIFLFIDEKKKLNLLKYNNNLKNIMNISLINYKMYFGRYIIYEGYNKVKEFYIDDDILAFEGEYLNGKRSGKGKEYYNGKLIFEGEYLNGKRSGKGKEYYEDKLLFEGDFLNGKMHNGKVYDILNQNIAYELKDGKGFIKEYNINNHLKFEGEY